MTNQNTEVQHSTTRPLPTLRDLLAVLFRHRRVMIGSFLCAVILVVLSGSFSRTYEAHLKILVLHQRQDAVVTAQADTPVQMNPEVSEEDLNSEVELLRSEDLLRKVVLATGLQRGHSLFGRNNSEASIASAVRKLGQDLDVQPIRKTNIIAVKYRSSDPRMAAQVLRAVEDAYMEEHLQVHRPSGEFTFFDQQTEQFRRGLEKSQAELAEFTRDNGVVSASLERDLTLQQAAQFEASAHQAQASAAETAQRIRSLQAQLRTMQPRLTTQIQTGENPQLMGQLKSTLLNLELKRTELLTKFDPSYRLVQEVEKQIADTRASIAAEDSKPVRHEVTDQDPTYTMLRSDLAKAEEDLSGLNARAAAAAAVASGYRETARNLQQRGIQQEDLQRLAKIQEQNYLLYVRKREEARIGDALDRRGILNVAIMEHPVVPVLPASSRTKSAAIALLLGIFGGLGAAFVTDFADPCFRTPDEVTAVLGIPVLASLPRDKS